MESKLTCPVDFIAVNENQVRITAGQVLLLAFVWLWVDAWPILAFMSIDFFLRAANLGKYSLLNLISGLLVKKLAIANKSVDRAPKKFAALVGFIFSITLLTFSLLGLQQTAIVTMCVLILFAILESVFAICAGCYVYSFLQKIRLIK